MAALPSMMRMSLSAAKSMERPVGNSPGPDTTLIRTWGLLLSLRPVRSSTVTINCTSSVPSALMSRVLLASSLNLAGSPSTGHWGGALWAYSLRYQYHERLGKRK